MAKKVNIEDEEVLVTTDEGTDEGTETSTEETIVEQPTVRKNDTTVGTVSTAKKFVKIRAVENIDCLIACKPYVILKDKEASVPVDVAAILCYAKKAYRL